MGMPITIEVVHAVPSHLLDKVFDFFTAVDQRYSTYKADSEISRINRGLPPEHWSQAMQQIFDLCEETKRLTGGYFDIERDGTLDPSGLVKGWAIQQAAQLLLDRQVANFYIEAGGDIQVHGNNVDGEPWAVGIRNPFESAQIIKVVQLSNQGIATSGTYVRGQHIYNPHQDGRAVDALKSLTVIGPNVYEADRFATAAFAMGEAGIGFIEALPGFEGYAVDTRAVATRTSGFGSYEAML